MMERQYLSHFWLFCMYICLIETLHFKDIGGAWASEKPNSALSSIPFRPHIFSRVPPQGEITLNLGKTIHMSHLKDIDLPETPLPLVSTLLSCGIRKTQLIHQLLDLPQRNRSFILRYNQPRMTLSFPMASRVALIDAELPFQHNKHSGLDEATTTVTDTIAVESSLKSNAIDSLKSRRKAFKLLEFITRYSSMIIIPIEESEIVQKEVNNQTVLANRLWSTLYHIASIRSKSHIPVLSNQTLHLMIVVLKDPLLTSFPDSVQNVIERQLQMASSNRISNIRVHLLYITDSDSVLFAKRRIHHIATSYGTPVNLTKENLVDALKISEETPEFLTFSEILQDHVCKTAMRDAMTKAEETFREWNRSVKRSLVIKEFGKLATNLCTEAIAKYEMLTLSSMGSFERQKYKQKLISKLYEEIRVLIFRQLILIERQGRTLLRSALLNLTTLGSLPSSNSKQLAVDRVVKVFKDSVAELVVSLPTLEESLLPVVQNLCKLYENSLSSYAGRFDSLPIASLKSEGKLQTAQEIQNALQQKSHKRKRGIRMGFALTAMLRQDGSGNLQGFTNYENGPLLFTLGYANDRNLPEALQNGKKPPFFRIQPKFHFDINL